MKVAIIGYGYAGIDLANFVLLNAHAEVTLFSVGMGWSMEMSNLVCSHWLEKPYIKDMLPESYSDYSKLKFVRDYVYDHQKFKLEGTDYFAYRIDLQNLDTRIKKQGIDLNEVIYDESEKNVRVLFNEGFEEKYDYVIFTAEHNNERFAREFFDTNLETFQVAGHYAIFDTTKPFHQVKNVSISGQTLLAEMTDGFTFRVGDTFESPDNKINSLAILKKASELIDPNSILVKSGMSNRECGKDGKAYVKFIEQTNCHVSFVGGASDMAHVLAPALSNYWWEEYNNRCL